MSASGPQRESAQAQHPNKSARLQGEPDPKRNAERKERQGRQQQRVKRRTHERNQRGKSGNELTLAVELHLGRMQVREVAFERERSAGVEVQEVVLARAGNDDGAQPHPDQAERQDGNPGLERNAERPRRASGGVSEVVVIQ